MVTETFMMYVFRQALLALFLAATTPLLAAEDYQQLAGTYIGEVFNGADLDSVTTTFSFDNNGRLSGRYTVDEENGVYSGRLSNFSFEGPRTISMEWTDKFGEGFATMEFSRDFTSFTGAWGSLDSDNMLPWNGKKQ